MRKTITYHTPVAAPFPCTRRLSAGNGEIVVIFVSDWKDLVTKLLGQWESVIFWVQIHFMP